MKPFKTLKVRLILYSKGRILLLKQTKPNGGNYTLVGGTVEDGEFAAAALVRETAEEAGITIREKDLELVHVLHKKGSTDNRITLYFKTNMWEGQLQALEKEKFNAVSWFPLYDLPDNITDTVKQVLNAYRMGLTYSERRKK